MRTTADDQNSVTHLHRTLPARRSWWAALLLGVHDDASEAVAPGSHLKLCDPTGTVVAEWRVDTDGNLEFRGSTL